MLRRLLAVLALAAAVLSVTGCGTLRLESDDPPAPSAGPQEPLRQQHAVQTLQLAELAQAAAATDPDLAPLLEAIVQDARAQLEVLGGVWEPSGRHLQAIPPRGDATAVEAALAEAATSALDAAIATEGDIAEMFAGMAISRSLRADQLAAALGTQPGAVEPALPSTLDADAAADLVRTLDALGQAWEIVAARADDPDPAIERAEARRDEAQEIAEIAGVADTAEDPRAVAYELDTSDVAATIADLEGDLMPCWLAQVTTTAGDDRRAVVDLALAAARDAGLAAPEAQVPAIAGTSMAFERPQVT